MTRRFTVLCLSLLGAIALGANARADSDLKVVETGPANNAVIGGPSDGFFVRFDKPVDHIRSLLTVRQGGKVVETLRPRFKTEPEVLFARAPNLPPGEYTLHWSVKTLQGTDVVEGEIAFSVSGKR